MKLIKGIVVAVVVVVCAGVSLCQTPKKADSKTLVYVSHTGRDRVGADFFASIRRELTHSAKYGLGIDEGSPYDRRFRFYIDLVTIDSSSNGTGSRSTASVVIEHMGLPNSYPVPTKWYHKAFLLEPSRVDELAKQLVSDMDAHWCNYIKNSVGNCPKETIAPIYP